ncbi:nucleotide exchange factor GrpE [Methanofollis fontis]|uniref:Protein GrpE n=1 Tax=Methanofollis fontis TaxID=2052832 RepID=A0A483CM04_9EURY|nr:nucleotide exchange factor GrpE [Methanofollis fontis]TAJ43917.1 nucleotide exchange factor GrpE [Methanofollis fontis]
MTAEEEKVVPGHEPASDQPGPDQDVPQDTVDNLKKENEDLKMANADLNERYLRLAADFENFRKRTDRQIAEIREFALQAFAADLLEVADNFERALQADDASLREGLESIQKQFIGILERNGITPLDCLDCEFNPEEHEAMVCVPSDKPEGTVVEEFIRGYCMHDRVIRHAKVAVSKNKEQEE